MKKSAPLTLKPILKPTLQLMPQPARQSISYRKLHKICICLALFCALSNMASSTQSSQNVTPQEQDILKNSDNEATTQNPPNPIESSEIKSSEDSQNIINTQNDINTTQSTPNLPKTKGGFIGIESSYVGMKYEEKGTLSTNSSTREAFSGSGVKVGLLGGYRYFFTQGVGLRGYANIDYFQSDSKIPISNIEALHYGINADFMMNFYKQKYFEIGAFVGISLGGVYYFGNGINTIKSEASTSNQGYKVRQNSLEVGMQLGVHTVIYKSIGLEFIARIPFMPHYFINQGSEANIISRQVNQSYSLGARILYNF